METKAALDILSLFSSVASIVLGVGAIWLSVVFFKMSSDASRATAEAAKDISANVRRLETLFDKLYSDTFTMMKDTVDDMRNHIWKRQDGAASEGLSETLKHEIEQRVKVAVEAAGIGSKEKQEKVTKAVESVVESLVKTNQDRLLSAEADKVMDVIRFSGEVTPRELATILGMDIGHLVTSHLFPLRESGKITWPGSKNKLNYSAKISPKT